MMEKELEELYLFAAEGPLGDFEANGKYLTVLGGIAKLRARIDELGGYHDDV